ncbi:MAG: flippase-like domain-containing protein [Chloroflexi bacterium]|nr:flippase-like domain-containing protein [Chloroflexota bacterium]
MKQLRVILGLLISAAFFYFAFRKVQFDEVGEALRRANYIWLIPAVGAIVLSITLRAVRWRLLFYPNKDLRFSSVFGSLNVGYLVNDILPMRLGEVVRAYLVGQLEGVSATHALSTVAVERVLDMVVTLGFLAALLPFVDLPAGAALKIEIVTVLAVGALLVMLVAGAKPKQTHTLAGIVTRRLPARLADRVHSVLDSFLGGFAVLSRPGLAAQLVVLSVVLWALAALGMYLVMFAFHLYLSPAAPLFVLALVSLSFVVPASPGYVGVFHLAAQSALQAFDVSAADALSYAFVAHIVAFAPPMVMGAAYLWRAGISWDRIFAFRRGGDDSEPPGGGGGPPPAQGDARQQRRQKPRLVEPAPSPVRGRQ